MLDKLLQNNPDFTAGQAMGEYVRTKLLTSNQLSTVQEATVLKIKGGDFEPTDPDKVLAEIQRNLFDSDWESLIRILKQFPKASTSVKLPANAQMDNQLWRLNNLYHIVDKYGKLIPFKLNEAQLISYKAWLESPKQIILKSRQHGLSTLWLILALDTAMFKSHQSLGLMSQGLSESRKLFARISTAIQHLPNYVFPYLNLGIDSDNMNELKFTNGSTIYIATSFRSGTLQFLHVSELGKIAAEHPERVKELKTGSLQTLAHGTTIIIESTAMGENEFKTMWTNAVDGKTDYTPIFLSWMIDPTCVADKALVPVDEAYFAKIDYEFSEKQKNFYTNKLVELQGDMASEYPSTADEAFSATSIGRYYEKLLQQNVKMQITDRPLFDPRSRIYIGADLGVSDISSYIVYQVTYEGVNVLACIAANEEPIDFFATELSSWLETTSARYNKNLRFKQMYLPHDSKKRDIGFMKSAVGIWNSRNFPARVMKRTASVAQDIKVIQSYLPYVQFDMNGVGVKELVDSLKKYSRKFVSGYWSNQPEHKGSDIPDSFRACIMSTPVQQKKIKELVLVRQGILESAEEALELEKGTAVVQGVVLTGDKNYWAETIKDAEEYDRDLAHNSRNSTVCSDDDGIVDGLLIPGGGDSDIQYDIANEEFSDEFGGSSTKKSRKGRGVVDGLDMGDWDYTRKGV